MSIRIALDSFLALEQDIRRILAVCDHEFLPPLSQRKSTLQKNLDSTQYSDCNLGLNAYLNGLSSQSTLIARANDEVVGFLSFINNYSQSEIANFTPSNHVTTICVLPEGRGKKITRSFYEYIFNDLPGELKTEYVSTRTWSTNYAHIKILEQLNFSLVHEIPNDRGQGISTHYYARSV